MIRALDIPNIDVSMDDGMCNIRIGDQALTIKERDSERLCIALEKEHYDELTYDELADENVGLKCKVEELERELEMYRDNPVREIYVPM